MSSRLDGAVARETVGDGITEECVHPSCSSFALVDSISSDGTVACPSCSQPFVIKVLNGAVWTSWRHEIEDGFVEQVAMPELQSARRERFAEEFDLGEETAEKLTSTHAVADFFEELASKTDAATAATFVADTLLGELHYRDLQIDAVDAGDCTTIVTALSEDQVTWRAITPVVRSALDNGRPIDAVFEEADVGKTDTDELDSIVEDVVDKNDGAVADYRDGKDEALNSLIGAVMQATDGQADAKEARERLVATIQQD